jgi:hypothetical protein
VPPNAAISIVPDAVANKFTLRVEGEDWSESHDTEEAAVLRAWELVKEETRLTVYGSDGRRLVVATIFPKGD